MNEFRVQLRWPDRDLSPNARVHWAKEHKAAAAAKNIAFFTAKSCGAHNFAVREGAELGLTVIIQPPDRRRRDEDNIKASLKPYIDGLMFALGIDDVHIADSYNMKLKEPIMEGQITMVIQEKELGKPWRCYECKNELGIVVRNPSGSHVLLIQRAGGDIEIDSGTVTCPVCGKQRKFVVGENRLEELLDSWRKSKR